jgi:putative ABC transport system ATP-binding protein
MARGTDASGRRDAAARLSEPNRKESTVYELHDVTKRYETARGRVDALRGVDLTIDDGAFVAIQGPTGQGKSTLLTLLGGLDRPTAGSVSFRGRDVATLSDAELTALRAADIGFVFQGFNLIPTLTALENVETALVPLDVDGQTRRCRAMAALDDVGLSHRARHVPGEMSGGEQQRTAIARALVKEPGVVLADEPTGNLDQDTRDEIVGLLERLWRERGVTLVVVTHDEQVAARAATRARIADGTLVPVTGLPQPAA